VTSPIPIAILTDYAAAIAGERQLKPSAVLGRSRSSHLIQARQQLWAELYRDLPEIFTISMLSRLASRDRATIRHGIRQHAERERAARLRARRCA
jgi:hypothetical protein